MAFCLLYSSLQIDNSLLTLWPSRANRSDKNASLTRGGLKQRESVCFHFKMSINRKNRMTAATTVRALLGSRGESPKDIDKTPVCLECSRMNFQMKRVHVESLIFEMKCFFDTAFEKVTAFVFELVSERVAISVQENKIKL